MVELQLEDVGPVRVPEDIQHAVLASRRRAKQFLESARTARHATERTGAPCAPCSGQARPRRRVAEEHDAAVPPRVRTIERARDGQEIVATEAARSHPRRKARRPAVEADEGPAAELELEVNVGVECASKVVPAFADAGGKRTKAEA